MKRESRHRAPEGPKPSGATHFPWSRLAHSQAILAYLFLLPTLVVLAGVVVYPFFSAIWISLENKVAGQPGKWIWLDNYWELLRGENCPDNS